MTISSNSLFTSNKFGQLKQKANELFARTIDQNISLAITGLSRSGKTAFITSLVNQLLNEGSGTKLSFFDPVHQGNLIATKRVPQKNVHVPRFDYDGSIAAITSEPSKWPEATNGISELRLAIRYQPKNSLLRYASDMATLTLDITDYPGEWLLDLPMLKQTYQEWSQQTHQLMMAAPRGDKSQAFLERLSSIDPFSEASEELLSVLAKEYTELLHTFRYELGLSVIQPGRFILPGELAGAPILEFFPFPGLEQLDANAYQNAADTSVIGMLRARYLEYKEQVVRRFYKQHFVSFDRQIVLADCLTPLNNGKQNFNDLALAISMILQSYHYGKSSFLSRLFSPKIDKLLFAASKADHVTPEQHTSMVSLLNHLIHQNKQALNFDAVTMKTLAIASIKSTQSGVSRYQGKDVPVIQGKPLNTDKGDTVFAQKITVFPGVVPKSLPNDAYWQNNQFNFIEFAPLRDLNQHECLPHVRMDQVLQFLIADKMI